MAATEVTSATRELAEFVVRAGREDLPDDLGVHVRRSVLDCLGVAMGAVEHPSVGMMLDVVDQLGGNPQATIWATNRRTSVNLAALANGQMAHVLDFDDSYVPEVTVLHGNAPVVPAALGVAELVDARGSDFALAFALGFEVAARVALSGGPGHYGQGFHVTATVGGFGAAAAAGKLLGLTAEQLTYAFGIACAQASGTSQGHGNMTKSFGAGKAAQAGVLAALLAKRGYTSGEDSLFGTWGFHQVFPSSGDREAMIGELGERWELRRAAFKPYACGVLQHALIDAALHLRDEEGIRPEDVESVEGRVHRAVLRATGKENPQSDLEGKFSAYHSIAVAFVDGGAGPVQYTDERVSDPIVRELRDRVRLNVEDGIQMDESHLRVRLRDGRVFDRHIPHASGSAEHPMSDAQIERKFRLLVDPILGEERAAKIVETVAHLDELQSIGELASLLTSTR
jgi:2-methylcitrate dehydratase PrpD